MRKRWIRVATIIAVVAVVAGLVAFGMSRNRQQDVVQPAISGQSSFTSGTAGGAGSATPTAATGSPSGSASVTPSAAAAGCPSEPGLIENPTTLTLISQGRELPMLSLGTDQAEGAPAAPPGDASHTVAWWNEGPLLGSDEGHAVLTSHTYQFGGALGNELNNGLLAEGDLVLVRDADGDSVCYRYSGSAHVMVADYDPDSDILYDFYGAPRFAMVVCSDYDIKGEPLGRIIHYGDLVAGPVDAAPVGASPAPASPVSP